MKKLLAIVLLLLVLTGCKEKVCDHEYGDYTVVKQATCVDNGIQIRVCNKCHEVDMSYILPNDSNHEYEYIEMIDDTDEGLYRCSKCSKEETLPLKAKDLNIPIIRMNGDFSLLNATKNQETYTFSYEDENISFEGYAGVKLQGASSINYPKKNYTVKLYEDAELNNKLKVELFSGLGKQSKYVLKANWIDYSQSRNVVSGIIYNDVAKSRDIDDPVSKLANGGVVNGYPVVVYENGHFHGLYTLNVPKDDYMFGMKKDDEDNPGSILQAALSTNTWSGYSRLFYNCPYNLDNFKDIEIEYLSTEDTIGDKWAIESFNSMINFINTHDGQSFKDEADKYLNIDRTIDSLIYTYVISAPDNIAKNINYITYDGVIWQPNVYDMDGSWGLYWNGNYYGYDQMIIPNEANVSLLYSKIFNIYNKEVKQRYKELRNGPLSDENIIMRFNEFFDKIPENIKQMETTKWNVPGKSYNNLEQIIDYTHNHMRLMDNYYLN